MHEVVGIRDPLDIDAPAPSSYPGDSSVDQSCVHIKIDTGLNATK
jgi:hypothetical protein